MSFPGVAGALAVGVALAANAQSLTQHWKLDDPTLAFSDHLAPLVNQVAGGAQAYVHDGTNAVPEALAGQPGATPDTGTSVLTQNRYQRIELGNVTPGSGAFTIAFWFNRNSAGESGFDLSGNQEHILSANQGQTGRWNLNVVNWNSSTEKFNLQFFNNPAWNGGQSSVTFASGLASDTWYHFAMTRNATNGFKLFLNGAEVFSGTNPNSFTAGANGVWLGLDPNVTAVSRAFTGFFDDVRCYDDALNGEQVAGLVGLGPVLAVKLDLVRTQMGVGTFQPLKLLACYGATTNDVGAASETRFILGTPGVVSVTGGRLTALGPGTTTLVASFGGKSDTNVISVVPLAPAQLIHRYSFAADANDLIGTRHGMLVGGNASVNEGALRLTPPSQYDFNYADFGADVITGCDEVTCEAWASFGANANWARMFAFGNSDGVDGVSFIMLTPHSSSGTTRLQIRSGGSSQYADALGTLDHKTNQHIVAVLHPLAGYLKLYLNGQLAAQNTNITRDLGAVTNVNSYLGQSLYFADPSMDMAVDEFRMYRGVMFPTNVAINAAAGPNTVVSQLGVLQSVSLAPLPALPELSFRSTPLDFRGDFANVANVRLTEFPGITYTSSSTNVAVVDAQGTVIAIHAGSATITATCQGQSASRTLTVLTTPWMDVLVADAGSNRVQRFRARGTNWVGLGSFAQGSYGGQALDRPGPLAADTLGNIYIGEIGDGGRILKFTAAGEFVGVMGTEGTEFTGDADDLKLGPDGNLYLSVSFGSRPSDMVYRITLPAGTFSPLIETSGFGTGGSYTLENPRGLAFSPDGKLYVASRGAYDAGSRPVLVFNPTTTPADYLGELTAALTSPQAMAYDATSGLLTVSVRPAGIQTVSLGGEVNTVLADTVARNILGVLPFGGNVFFSDYDKPNIFIATSPSSSFAVVSSLSQSSVSGSGVRSLMTYTPPAAPPTLAIQPLGNRVAVTWSGGGTLQSAPQVVGVYTNLVGATSPHTNAVGAKPQFFRVMQP